MLTPGESMANSSTFSSETTELIKKLWGHAIGHSHDTRDILNRMNNPQLQEKYQELCDIFDVKSDINSVKTFQEVMRKAKSYLDMLEQKNTINRGEAQQKVLEKIEMLLSMNTSETM